MTKGIDAGVRSVFLLSLDPLKYDRTVIAYHGCDASVAEQVFAGKPFRKSQNDYDWLGEGIYFWEYGLDRALKFAEFQKQRGKVIQPAVIGAIIQLGRCFDLMDTQCTSELAQAFAEYRRFVRAVGVPMPKNEGKTPDRKLRHRDCQPFPAVGSASRAIFRSLSATLLAW